MINKIHTIDNGENNTYIAKRPRVYGRIWLETAVLSIYKYAYMCIYGLSLHNTYFVFCMEVEMNQI